MFRRIHRRLLLTLTLLVTFLFGNQLTAQRPTAPKLLPYNTVAYFRIANLPEFKAKLSETSIGKIGNNEDIQSLMSSFYEEFLTAYPEIEEELGMPLDELLDLPQGEVCVAVAVTDTGSVMFFLLVDFGDRIATTDKLLGRLDELVLAAGGSVEKEMVSETEVIVYDNPIDDNSPEVIIKDGTLVVTTNRLMTEHVVAHWEGTATAEQRTFSQNRKFTAIMRSSVGTEEARPHASWYFDPLTLVTATTQGNFAAQAAMAILPTIGLDGFKALGGSVILAPPGFDTISHTHIALAVPRRGVLDLLTFGTGDGTPEPWVPADVPAYITGYWNVDEAYDNLITLLDTVLGEGEFQSATRYRPARRHHRGNGRSLHVGNLGRATGADQQPVDDDRYRAQGRTSTHGGPGAAYRVDSDCREEELQQPGLLQYPDPDSTPAARHAAIPDSYPLALHRNRRQLYCAD